MGEAREAGETKGRAQSDARPLTLLGKLDGSRVGEAVTECQLQRVTVTLKNCPKNKRARMTITS